MGNILIDTNLLLDDANVIYKLSKEFEKIIIPLTVLKELDDKKYNPNLSYSARNAILAIKQFKEEFPDKITFHIGDDEVTGPDARIIHAAEETGSDWTTKLSFESFSELVSIDPIQVLLTEVEQDKKKCNFVQHFNLFSGLENGYPSSVRLFLCGKTTLTNADGSNTGEVKMIKAIQGLDYLYVITVL